MNVLKPHLQTTVLTLLAAGKSQREIARITCVDRKTIRSLVLRATAGAANSPGVATGAIGQAGQIPPPRPPAAPATSTSACEPHRVFITEQLRLRRNYTAIYQDLVDNFGFTAAYNSVKRFAGTVVAKEPAQFDRLEFAPGEEVQVDYGEGAMTRVPGTERYRPPRLFVMTLRYSRRSFRRVIWESSQQNWARLHEQAWRYFGGCCSYVVLDNLKEGVIKPDLYEPELNPVFRDMLVHYGVVADPARVRDPNRKGTVENAIQHTQSTALKGRRFETIEEQNTFLEQWEAKWAAQRIHGSARPGRGHVPGGARPPQAAAGGGLPLLHRARAHRRRRHLHRKRSTNPSLFSWADRWLNPGYANPSHSTAAAPQLPPRFSPQASHATRAAATCKVPRRSPWPSPAPSK